MAAAVNMFDGVAGRVVAKVMARTNREAEAEAIEALAPVAGDAVLALGIGPGVGVELLAEGGVVGRVVGIDPSAAMLDDAQRRNRTAIDAGVVELVRTTADRLPWPDESFDGAVAVNSIQLWEPLDGSLAEVARVLRPGARLVTLTHDWAVRRRAGRSPEEWLREVSSMGAELGLVNARVWRARAEDGRSVGFAVNRAGLVEP